MRTFQLPANIAQYIDQFSGRAWLPPILHQWFVDPKSEQTFVLTGGPGTGKSMIMGWLAAVKNGSDETTRGKLFQQMRAVHFCLANDRATYTPLSFADKIAQQLSKNIPEFDEALTSTLKGHGHNIVVNQNIENVEAGATVVGVEIKKLNLAGMTDSDAFDISFVQALQKLYERGYDQPILILVDALDEAWGANERGQDLVRALSKLDGLPSQVKILMTSRPDPRLIKHFTGARVFDLVNDAPDGIKDIQEFAESWLKHRSKWDETRAVQMAKRIDEAAAGIFLYGYMVLHDVVPTLPATADVNQFPLPKGLNGIYEEFFTRELGASMKKWFDELQPFLGLIAVAQGDGVTREKIRSLIDKEDDLRDKITANLYLCQQYFTGELNDGPFRPFHKSMTDFLLDDPENKTYEIDAKRMHHQYAKAYQSGTDWGSLDRYTLQYLPDHLAGAERYDDLLSLLLDFNYLQAKLDLTDINDLMDDFDYLPDTDRLSHGRLLQSALQLSATVLGRDKAQLATQLVGRLNIAGLLTPLVEHAEIELDAGNSVEEALALINRLTGESGLQAVVIDAENWRGRPWLRPLQASLISPGGPLIRTMTEHKASIDIALNYDNGRKVVSCDENGAIVLWDLETGEAVGTLDGHTDAIYGASLTADQTMLVTGGEDGTVRVWELQSRTEKYQLHLPAQESVAHLEVIGDGPLFLLKTMHDESYDEKLEVWHWEEKNVRYRLKHDEDEVDLWWVHPNGRQIITAYDETVRVWDALSGAHEVIFSQHEDWVSHLVLINDGKTAVSGDRGGKLIAWELASGDVVYEIEAHAFIGALCLSPDGRRLVSAGQSPIYGGEVYGTLKVWDALTGEPLIAYDDVLGEVNQLVWIDDGAQLISRNDSHKIQLWNLETKKVLLDLGSHLLEPNFLGIDPSGRYAVSTASGGLLEDDALVLWDLGSGQKMPLVGHRDVIKGVCFSPDGRQLFTFSQDQTVRVWDLTRPNALSKRVDHEKYVGALSTDTSGTRLVSAARDKAIKVWDMETQELLHTLDQYGAETPHMVRFLDNDQTVVCAGSTELILWDLKTGEHTYTQIGFELGRARAEYGSDSIDALNRITEGHTRAVSDVILTGDAVKMVTRAHPEPIIVWDLLSHPSELYRLTQEEDETGADRVTEEDMSPACIALSDDESMLLVGYAYRYGLEAKSADKVAGYDFATGKRLFSIPSRVSNQYSIDFVTFMGENQLVVAVDEEGAFTLWDIEKQELIASPLDQLVIGRRDIRRLDSRHLLCMTPQNGMAVYHLLDGELTLLFAAEYDSEYGFSNRLLQAAMSKDGSRFAITLANNDLELWDMPTQKRVCRYTAEFPLRSVLFLSNDRLVAGDEDGSLHWLQLEL